jgi:ABC-type antimicrobial peptide transport system permease subunit
MLFYRKIATGWLKKEKIMFNEPGKKIKRIAIGAFIVESIAAFIGGIACMVDGGGAAGLLIMIGGFFAAWVIAIFIYGFGQLVDKTEEIAENRGVAIPKTTTSAPKPTPTAGAVYTAEATSKVDNTPVYEQPKEIEPVNEQDDETVMEYKKQRLDSLYYKGAITEEEYKKAIMKLMK